MRSYPPPKGEVKFTKARLKRLLTNPSEIDKRLKTTWNGNGTDLITVSVDNIDLNKRIDDNNYNIGYNYYSINCYS